MSRKSLIILSVCMLVLVPVIAFAVNTPQNGDAFYDIYKILIKDFLQGPVGFVAAVIAIIFGFMLSFQQKFLPGVVAVALGIVMIKADSLVSSMGSLF